MYTINKVKSLPLFSGCHKRYNIYISLLLLFLFCFLFVSYSSHGTKSLLLCASQELVPEREREERKGERKKKKPQKSFLASRFSSLAAATTTTRSPRQVTLFMPFLLKEKPGALVLNLFTCIFQYSSGL